MGLREKIFIGVIIGCGLLAAAFGIWQEKKEATVSSVPEPTTDSSIIMWRKQPVAGVDAETFKIINAFYAVDKDHVYYWQGCDAQNRKAQVFSEADPGTFRVMEMSGSAVTVDGAHVYITNFCDEPRVATDLDPETLVFVNGYYFKDKNAVYHFNQNTHEYEPVNGADPTTFVDDETSKNQMGIFGRDVNYVYLSSFEFPQPANEPVRADAQTFIVLDETYAKDKDRVYWIESYGSGYAVLESADSGSFVPLTQGYAKDNNRVYGPARGYEWRDIVVLENADPKSFEVLLGLLAKDDQTVYLNLRPFSVEDPKTFAAYEGQSQIFHDASAVYFFIANTGLKLPGVDGKTFIPLLKTDSPFHTRMLGRDNQGVYAVVAKEINEIRGEYEIKLLTLPYDPETFEYNQETSSFNDKNGPGMIDWDELHTQAFSVEETN